MNIGNENKHIEPLNQETVLNKEKKSKEGETENLSNEPVILNLENWQLKSPEEKLGIKIVEILQANGHKAFFVGGYVRDLLMNQFHGTPFKPHDVDVATGARYNDIKQMLDEAGMKYVEIGSQYGILKVISPKEEKDGGTLNAEIEIATFRTEGEYENGRRPSVEQIQFVEDPREDAIRRDFTINSLFFNPVDGQVVDYTGGIEDIRNKNLRFVGNQGERIADDKLRMLRYVRFLTRYDLPFSKDVRDLISEHSQEIEVVSKERIREEIQKMLEHPKFWSSINNLFRVGLLPYVLPELAELYKVEQSAKHHAEGDAYRHTLEVLRSLTGKKFLEEASEILGAEMDYTALAKSKPDLIWSALFHDIGKAQTKGQKISNKGEIETTFYGHEQKSEEMSNEICRRLRFPNDEVKDVEWLIGRHMTIMQFPRMNVSNQKKLMLDKRFSSLLLLHLGDSLGSSPSKLETYETIKKIYLEYTKSDEYKQVMENSKDAKAMSVALLVNGGDLKSLGLKPSPLFKKILSDVEEQQLEGGLSSKEEALEYIKTKYV